MAAGPSRGGAKRICATFANGAENEPSEADLIYGISVTQLEKNGDSQAQAQAQAMARAMVRAAVITDFCPQWKVLLRQRRLSGIPEVLFVTRWQSVGWSRARWWPAMVR
jgi:hypothetical protein